MPRDTVLLIGRGSVTSRLTAHFRRRGCRVRTVRDCGAAMESLREEAPQAVVLDVAGAGFAAPSFREMVRLEHPRLAFFELPGDEAGSPQDLGLLLAAFDRGREAASEREGRDVVREEVPAAAAKEAEAEEPPLTGYKFEDLTSNNPRMLELFDLIPRVARTDSPILVHGETGTGKELVAAAIHRQSLRKDGPFFTVNCGALTETLLESELFGHERGAFTGAYRRKEGYFELAHKGTLFLDELGTVSPAMQVKLLRVLERMEVRRVGGGQTIAVDVRIVAATNSRLEDAVAAGTFREDLYYRINVVPITVPPLRDRSEDVPLLADLFRRKFAQRQGRDVTGFERGALRLLVEYPWPGNVRELQNVVERAVILCAGRLIQEKDLPERLGRLPARRLSLPAFDAEEPLDPLIERLALMVEREYLKRVLRKYHGQVSRAAEHAGLNRRTLYNKMRRHGIRKEDYRQLGP